jgi:hypothetical protein
MNFAPMPPRSQTPFGNALVGATLSLRYFLIIAALLALSSLFAQAKYEAPGAYSVQITFYGSYSNEPVEIEAAGKTTTVTLNTGPAVPMVSGPTNIYIGGLVGTLKIRFPRLKLTKAVEINLRNGQYIYVNSDGEKPISVDQTIQARGFD